MKKLFFLFVLLFMHGLISGQVPPRNIIIKPTVITPIQVPIKGLFTFPLTGSVYVLEPGLKLFWAADIANKKLASQQCIANINVYQWRFVSNPDGSYNILTEFNNALKLVYQRSTIVIPNVGFSHPRPADEGFALKENTSSSAAFLVFDKIYLKDMGNGNYRLLYNDRRDSMQIKIYTVMGTPVNNISFSFGDLSGWQSTGNAFDGQPSSVNHIPFYTSPVVPNMPLGGSYWKDIEDTYYAFSTKTDDKFINTARPGVNRWRVPDESKTGSLLSVPFFNCSVNLTFKIAGTQNATDIQFQVLQKLASPEAGSVALSDGNYKILKTYTGHNNDIARWEIYRNPDMQFGILRFRIIDNSVTGHIVLDDIAFNYTGALGPGPIPSDPPIAPAKPVFGTIDMHTHPMSFMGMGGKLMYGKLDGDPNIALGNCNAMHGGWGTDNPNGNYLRAEIVNLVDEHFTDRQARLKLEDAKVPHNDHPHDGFPGLVYWPAQNSMIHQQMWFEWLMRANQGGLKAIIALTVNSELLCKALGGDNPFDDKTTADNQIDSLIAFVRRHRTFLDTVTTAARMRQVITSGRMAVIIGMEIDNIGGFYKNANVTKDDIRNEITRLKNKGVRYIFPIHVVDNKFGGTALYKDLFNISNKFSTGRPLVGTVPASLLPPVLPGEYCDVETAPDPRIGFTLSTMNFGEKFIIRTLAEIVELGGLPLLPPPPIPDPILLTAITTANVAILVAKPIVDPVITALKFSEQYQLLKKYYLDPNLIADKYARTRAGHRNVLGLFDLGKFAVAEMMRQGMMIDVDHASERSVNDMIRIAVMNDYPVNSGHNGLRGTNDVEKTRTIPQMDTIARLGGMFGMGWENQTPHIFAENYRTHLSAMKGKNTSFGSDIGGYAATIRKPTDPRKFITYTSTPGDGYLTKSSMAGTSRTWDFNTEGMVHIGLYPDFFEALKKDGVSLDVLHQFFLGAENFIQMWEKCERRAPLVAR